MLLNINEKKTEHMEFHTECKDTLTTSSGTVLSLVPEFRYFGANISSSAKEISVRISLAWTASLKLEKICKSKLERSMKYKNFAACVESVLFYGSEKWVLTQELRSRLDGTHSNFSRKAYNVPRYDFESNVSIYVDKQKASEIIRLRRMKLAGHCIRHAEVMANMDLFWSPKVEKLSDIA